MSARRQRPRRPSSSRMRRGSRGRRWKGCSPKARDRRVRLGSRRCRSCSRAAGCAPSRTVVTLSSSHSRRPRPSGASCTCARTSRSSMAPTLRSRCAASRRTTPSSTPLPTTPPRPRISERSRTTASASSTARCTLSQRRSTSCCARSRSCRASVASSSRI